MACSPVEVKCCLICQLLMMKLDNTFKFLSFLVLKRHELYTRKITIIFILKYRFC